MRKLDIKGAINALLIPFILIILLFLGACAFGFWAYSSRQDYKDNADAKIDKAVEVAVQINSEAKDKEFIQREKKPLRTYNGPEDYGSVTVKYPKTWSVYAVESANSANPVDAYLNPGFVPGVTTQSAYALRVQVAPRGYSSEIQRFDSLVKTGKLKATPFKFSKVPKIVGMRLNGEIEVGKQGSIILVPLRDKTLKVFTEASQFVDDFDKIILPNLSFSP